MLEKKISVVMVTLNEEKAVGKVITDIKKATDNKAEIVVVDSSSDRTPYIAKSLGARVIRQKPRGYGIALKKALLSARGDVIFTIDCDDTYPAEAIPEFMKEIANGYDIVGGSRIMHMKKSKNMPLMKFAGNVFFSILVFILYRKLLDVTTGMRAYRKEVIKDIEIETNYSLPAELIIKPIKKGYMIKDIPIDYRSRIGNVTIKIWRSGKAFLKYILTGRE
jgi:glycosyltransferase involved in cell wall biosynthesis